MKAVFDTNILIDVLNGHQPAAAEVARYRDRLISVVTWLEIVAGAKSKAEEETLRRFVGGFVLMPLDAVVADLVIALRRETRLKLPDAIVYATARVSGCSLVTRDTRAFDADWPDVRVPYRLP